jgi:hypothetical protein|uniref:Uncharacterized protein n=2 Tax=unclassified Caudoviricetes TaxID=2788787 RepID=A0A8S5MVM0_9CAUD|nr:MAG TPA: hypothetical protein [Siphoviridae sp. ctsBB38]DAF99130.1 MAG TPA: hypothetical protein [Siphoviridae sp. ctOxh11]
MVDVDTLKVLILEDQYPTFTDDQLEEMAKIYDNIYQLAYVCCLAKASADEITIGAITIKNSADMWNNMAAMFLKQYESDSGKGKSTSITGKVPRRVDEQ